MAQLKDLLVSGAAKFLNGIDIIGDLTLAGNLLPDGNGKYNLGSKDNHWKQGYIDKLGVNSEGHDLSYADYADKSLFVIGDSLFEGNINLQGDILPTEKDKYKVGSKDLYWKNIYGSWLKANPQSSSTDGGITLYGDDATYSIMFRGTSGLGKLVNTTSETYGISSDLATYFTISDTPTRGWIFRRGSTNIGGITGNGTFITSVASGSHLAANQGKVAVDLTAAPGNNMALRFKSTDGVFTEGVYQHSRDFYYTTDTNIKGNKDTCDYSVSLLNQNGLTELRNLIVDDKNHSNSSTAVGNGAVYIYKSNAHTAQLQSGQLVVGSTSSAYNGSTGGGDVALELWRGKNASWQLLNTGGVLKFKNNYTAAVQSSYTQDSLWLDYNSGAGYIPNLKIASTDKAGFNTIYKLYVDGTTYTTGQIHIDMGGDPAGLNQDGALVIGTKTGINIGIDANEIQARNNSKASTFYLNPDGGLVSVGAGGLESNGNVYPKSTNSKSLGTSSLRWSQLYVGTANTYGANTKPIFWNNGVPTASTATVGSETKPVYMNAGAITQISYLLEANIYSFAGSLADDLSWKNFSKKPSLVPIIGVAYNNDAAVWNSGTYSTSLVFGSHDTRGLLDCASHAPIVTLGGGSHNNSNDSAPNWYFKLKGTGEQTYTFPTSSKILAANDGSNASGFWDINAKYATLLANNKEATNVLTDVGDWQPRTSSSYKYVWQQNWRTSDLKYTDQDKNAITITDTADLSIWLSGNPTQNELTANMNIDGVIYAMGGIFSNGLIESTAGFNGMIRPLRLTGGDGNTTGYRLVATIPISEWTNYRAVFAVAGRHSGCGIIAFSIGCNNSTVSQNNVYAEIRYFGTFPAGDGIIDTNNWLFYVSADGTEGYLFWKYYDYCDTTISILQSHFNCSNGPWMTSIDSNVYGICKATVVKASATFFGTDNPSNGIGRNGDIYIKYSS